MTEHTNVVLSLSVSPIMITLGIIMIYDIYMNLTKTMTTGNINRFLILMLDIIGLMGAIVSIAWSSAYMMHYDDTFTKNVAIAFDVISLGVGIVLVIYRIQQTRTKE